MVNDGIDNSLTTYGMTIDVTADNDDPVANNDSDTTQENTQLITLDVLANDTDVDTTDILTVTLYDATSTQLGTVLNDWSASRREHAGKQVISIIWDA